MSGSSSSSGYSTEVLTCANGDCIGGVVARSYKVTFNLGSTTGCGSEYIGDTVVKQGYDVSGASAPSDCSWSSLQSAGVDELGNEIFDGVQSRYWQDGSVCADGGTAKVVLHMDGTGVYVTVFSGLSFFVTYKLTTPSVINCIGTMVLPILSGTSTRNSFVQNVTGVSGAGSACPATVTVTPL